MASSLETLIKILRLEEQKGYQNQAVIGGFARFAFHWAREAHNQAQTDEHHAVVEEIASRLRTYDDLDRNERPALIAEVVGLATGEIVIAAEETTEESAPPPPTQTAEPEADDVGIGEVDEDDEDDGFEVFGTFEPEMTQEEESVRARRGYAWQQQHPVGAEALAGLSEPVQTISGVGDTRTEQLARLGVETVGDMLTLLPRRYDDYSQMKTIRRLSPGEEVSVIGVIEDLHKQPMRRGGVRVEGYLDDGSGRLRLNWFNQPWIAQQVERGEPYVVSGKVDQYLGRLVMNSPELEAIDRDLLHAGRIVPIYPLTEGLGPRVMRRLVKGVVDEWAPRLPDPLPLELRERTDLMDYGDAIAQTHFPDSQQDLRDAKFRLAFEELFLLQLAMLQERRRWQEREGLALHVEDGWLDDVAGRLPYELTAAQRRAVADIRRDMAANVPMNRLLQGDVGSGKTVVAAVAAAIAVVNGTQAAFMAPTSILAEQHFASLTKLFERMLPERGTNTALLTGNLSQIEREAVYTGLADGSIDVVIGTHALIQPSLAFRQLGLAVIDEQHRFGVSQRGALRSKAGGKNPHLLVMTATPIPRTLALTLHADLDLTVIDEMPPGRTPTQTRILQPKERERAYRFIHGQVEKGQQAYVICPLVDESDKLDAKAATAEYDRLQNEVFPDLKVGLLHGQMGQEEKDAAMAAFYHGETDVLVSTTVIEVGIDVPNANVILIEDANRFGLAQLHQLRGRVGRGDAQSYCLLMSDRAFLDTDERLQAVEDTTDGFRLAEVDWKLRGAGDLLGTRQSGFGAVEFADLMNPELVDLVHHEARNLFEADPDLAAADHTLLAERVSRVTTDPGDVS